MLVIAAITIDIVLDTVLIDVLSYSPESMLIQQLRREADTALPRLQQDPIRALADMTRLDSVIRETLRIHPPNDHGMMRQIVKPGGVTSPNGIYLPEGTYVGAHVAAMQKDVERCHDADQYRPLRFYQDGDEVSTTAVHISHKFLPFALGRHAWYVVNPIINLLAEFRQPRSLLRSACSQDDTWSRFHVL